ncbi:MAG: TolC family protein [Deltaproteobacteria bacterium]|nr:TolC family protein [Deltaproteobacteria bacterium]
MKEYKSAIFFACIVFASYLFMANFSRAEVKAEEKTNISSPSAQEVLTISLKDAIPMALKHNEALKVEQVTPFIRQTYEEQEKSLFDPVLSMEISHSTEKSQQTSTNSGAKSTIKDEQTEAEVGVFQLFPTGTKVSLGFTEDREWSDFYGDQHTSRVGLTLTQALLQGAGLKVNSVRIDQARLDTFSSRYEIQSFTENLVSEVEKTYWDFALAQKQIEIFTESLRLAEQQMKETEERIQVGTLAQTEFAAAQAEVALRREDSINARFDLAKIRLKLLRLLNPPGASLWNKKVVLLDHPAVPQITLDTIESHVEAALQLRSDLNQARLELQRGDLEVVKTKNGLLPKLDFFITMGKTGYADSFSDSVKDIDGEGYDILAGLTLEYPFGWKDEKARHKRALLVYSQAEKVVNNLAQLVQIDVRTAYIEVNRTQEQVTATAATRTFQEEKLRAETEKFKVGKSTTLLVAQTQRDLVASRISEIKAMVSYLKALVELYRLEGSLLNRRGISSPAAASKSHP